MDSFLIFLLINALKVAAGLVVLGFALAGNFKKCEVETWKAFVPYYNVFVWVRLTKNHWLMVLVMLQFILLPIWWIIVISFIIYTTLILDTQSLYEKVKGYWGIVFLVAVVFSIVNVFLQPIALYVNIAGLAIGFIYLFILGRSSSTFDKERYYSKEFSFKSYAFKQFKKNKPAVLSVYILGILVLLAVYADYIANDQPIYTEYRGKTYFPAYYSIFEPNKVDSTLNAENKYERLQFDIANWKQLDLDKVVWAVIPYSPNKTDRYNREYVAPADKQRFKSSNGEIVEAPRKFRHHLGTDGIGQDVLSGLLHGSRISLTIGLISMGIASLIGIFLGALAGFYGDTFLRTTRFRYYMLVIGFLLGLFYLTQVTWWVGIAVFLGFLILSYLLAPIFHRGFLKTDVSVPVDSMVSRGIEVLNSLPRLIIIITISAVAGQRSIVLLMIIIGATSWTGIARFTRAELLRTRSLEFIDAAKSLGYNDFRVIFQHALPNSLAPVFVSIAFGIAAAILIESGLSFLGIGVPDDITTWGGMLNKGRQEFEAWWLVMFPGLAIFLTVTVYNLIGEALRDALDPKLKQ